MGTNCAPHIVDLVHTAVNLNLWLNFKHPSKYILISLFLGNCRYLDNILTIYESNLHVCKTNLSAGT
jgi:hypothetical protein